MAMVLEEALVMLTDKRRDMARSVLPSTKRRQAAVSLAAIRRRHRRSANRQLARLTGPVNAALLSEIDLGDDERFPNHLIHEVVLERRSYDKVASLIRWAVASTRAIRHEDRLSHLAAMLPANLIGRHAISHLSWCDEFAVDRPDRWTYIIGQCRHPLDDRAVLAELLHNVLERGDHQALNACLKSRPGCPVLLGDHDLGRFVDEVLAREPMWVRSERMWVSSELLYVGEQLRQLGHLVPPG